MVKSSIIIINYNNFSLIENCLKTLSRQNFSDFETLIVDNGSSDGSSIEIKRFLESNQLTNTTKLITIKKNLGFGGGCLEGLKHANGDYIALLNNDTELDNKWVEELVKAMESDPKVGICASKLVVYGSKIIDSAGDGYSTSLKGFKRGEGDNIELFNHQEYVFGACAGAALYRREMINQIGFLDDDFFLIYEDTDMNFRAQLAGWKVLYVPTAIVYHKVRSTIGNMSDMAVYYTLRNNELVRIKNVPIQIFIRCFPEFLIGVIIEFIYFAIKHRHFSLYLKAKINALRMFPKMLKKRSIIMKNKKVSNKYLLSIMTPVWQKDFSKSKIKKFLYA